MADCPDPIKNIEDAIESVKSAYVDSQIDALNKIGENLGQSADNLPPVTPTERKDLMCAALGTALQDLNGLRNSCTFDPTGCLRQVLDSGVLNGNPIAAGAALAAATFVDAATGNFTPPLLVPPPSVSIGVIPPSIPGDSINLPDIPAPPPSDECQDPVGDVNKALAAAEETYADLHQKASKAFANSINEFTGGLGGLPTNLKADVLCVGASAGYNAVADLSLGTCAIDVGECLRQVLESGVLGAAGGAAAGAAFFADAASGRFPGLLS